MNLFGFKPTCYNYLKEEFRTFIDKRGMDLKSELDIPTSLDKFVKNGDIRIKILMSYEKWFGVTYRDDKPYVVENIKKMIRKGIYTCTNLLTKLYHLKSQPYRLLLSLLSVTSSSRV